MNGVKLILQGPSYHRDILVVDEASMSVADQTAALLEDAERAGTKVVLVGDTSNSSHRCRRRVRAIQERVGAAHLDTIQRQHNEQDRQAFETFGMVGPIAAIENLAARGQVHDTTERWTRRQQPVRQ